MAAVSLRYARAFGAVASKAGIDPAYALQQIRDLADVVTASSQLREFLGDPSSSQEDKVRVLDAITHRMQLLPQVRNFIAVIVAHDRVTDLNDIVREYAAQVNEQAGISEAEITSARPLSQEDRKTLEAQIARLAGASADKVRATYHEDPSLLGGAVIRIGSTVYDGSIRAQLNQLKQRLVAAQVS